MSTRRCALVGSVTAFITSLLIGAAHSQTASLRPVAVRMSPEAYDALVLRGHTTKKWTVAELEEHLAFLRTWRENMKKVRQHG